jgi:hypothetical protein
VFSEEVRGVIRLVSNDISKKNGDLIFETGEGIGL